MSLEHVSKVEQYITVYIHVARLHNESVVY